MLPRRNRASFDDRPRFRRMWERRFQERGATLRETLFPPFVSLQENAMSGFAAAHGSAGSPAGGAWLLCFSNSASASSTTTDSRKTGTARGSLCKTSRMRICRNTGSRRRSENAATPLEWVPGSRMPGVIPGGERKTPAAAPQGEILIANKYRCFVRHQPLHASRAGPQR